MDKYRLTLTGTSPLIMHMDNIEGQELVGRWRDDTTNKKTKKGGAGDDRWPAWTWSTKMYHDGRHVILPADNLMTCLREGGSKVTKQGKESYKKQTQSGLFLDSDLEFFVGGKQIPVEQMLKELYEEADFIEHVRRVKDFGFSLFVKRARSSSMGGTKHIRVRPMFPVGWQAVGSVTILSPKLSGLTRPILQDVLDQCGMQCGIGDWRPSAPRAPGQFGRFEAELCHA